VKKPAIFLAFAMLAIAPAAMAKTQNISGSITGTFDTGSAGPCATGYASQCASGTCFHFQPATGTTPTGSGTIGKGTVTSMCVTVDAGNNVNAPADTDTKHTCSPIFGDLVYVTTKSGTVTAVNFAGVFCHHQDTSPTGTFEAGFGIDGANSTDTAATGWGTLTGTANKDTSKFSLKPKGTFTP
jgi:hypothetical protein